MTRAARKPARTRAHTSVVKKEATVTVAVPRGGAPRGRVPAPRRRTRKNDARPVVVEPAASTDAASNASTPEARDGKRALKPEPVSPAPHQACGGVANPPSGYLVVPTGGEVRGRPEPGCEENDAATPGGKEKVCVVTEFVKQYCEEHDLPVDRKDEHTCAEVVDAERSASAAREDFKARRREHDEWEYRAKINARKAMKNYKPNPKADKQDIRTMNNRRSASARRVYDTVFEAELLYKIDLTYNKNEELVRQIEAMRREEAELRKETNLLRRTHALRMAPRCGSPQHSPPPSDESPVPTPATNNCSPPPPPPSQLQLGMPQLADDGELVGGVDWDGVNQFDDVPRINGFETSPVSTRDSVNPLDTPLQCAADDELEEPLQEDFDVLVPLGADGQPMTSSQEEAVLKSMFPSQ